MTQFDERTTYRERAKDLFERSNRRHVIVEKGDHRIVYLPISIVVLAALLAVWLVAILAIIAVINGYSITLEPEPSPATPPAEAGTPEPPPPPAAPGDPSLSDPSEPG